MQNVLVFMVTLWVLQLRLLPLGKDDRIQSLVLDNGYLDLNIVVREELKREGYPTWLAPGAIWAASIFGGETFLEPSPQLAFIKHLDRPIFAMHGTADTRVLPHHTADMEVMAQLKGANLITWFADNATHSEIKYMYPDEFSSRVSEFFALTLSVSSRACTIIIFFFNPLIIKLL